MAHATTRGRVPIQADLLIPIRNKKYEMTCPNSSGSRHVEGLGVPWAAALAYEPAVDLDGIICVSDELSHTAEGAFIAPAFLERAGMPSDFSSAIHAGRFPSSSLKCFSGRSRSAVVGPNLLSGSPQGSLRTALRMATTRT